MRRCEGAKIDHAAARVSPWNLCARNRAACATRRALKPWALMSLPVPWIVSLMVALEPSSPHRATFERSAEAIARAAASDPLFDEAGEARTAALLVSIAWHESRLRPDAKSKNGQWLCLFQVDRRHLAEPKRALEDPDVCTRAAVKILKGSLAKCSKNAENERLAMFMSGACDKGLSSSRYRMFLAKKLLKDHPVPALPAPEGDKDRARERAKPPPAKTASS